MACWTSVGAEWVCVSVGSPGDSCRVTPNVHCEGGLRPIDRECFSAGLGKLEVELDSDDALELDAAEPGREDSAGGAVVEACAAIGREGSWAGLCAG